MPGWLERLNSDLAEVAARGRESLVRITDGSHGAGSGVIVHPEGLILTNAHVVSRRSASIGLADGDVLEGEVLAHDDRRDLAVVMIDRHGLPAMNLGDSRRAAPGEWVMAMGHPWGVEDGATSGVVIGVGSDLPDAPGALQGRPWIAVSLHLRPGHSGGPLIDRAGSLLGINTMMAGPDVGLAVPVDEARGFLKEALGRRMAYAAL